MSNTTTTTANYQQQASDFAVKHNVKLIIKEPTYGKHFSYEKQSRYIFRCTLKRNGKSYSFDFGQSIASGYTKPTMYDVLTCLQKYDVGTFEDFCSEFGYDTDSRAAERTYKAVLKEFAGVEKLFSDVIEELQEIQ